MALDGCRITLLEGFVNCRGFPEIKKMSQNQKFTKQEKEDYKNSLLIKPLTADQIASGLQITTGAEIGVIMDGDRIINPHVPLFMQKTPWYTDDDGFKGKRKEKGQEGWYERGQVTGTATKYRKGSSSLCFKCDVL